MSGTLHIFSRSVVNGSTHYQVNYNTPGSTYAKVFDSQDELREFLISVAEMAPPEVDQLWNELSNRHSATIGDIDIPEHEAGMLGLKRAPTDY